MDKIEFEERIARIKALLNECFNSPVVTVREKTTILPTNLHNNLKEIATNISQIENGILNYPKILIEGLK